MIKIERVASYVCENIEQNICKKFNNEDVDEKFLENKVGILSVSKKSKDEKASDLCINAFNQLVNKYNFNQIDSIDCLCVCTQNGDFNIPHTSAIVHNKLGLNKDCAVFDISLGCSGYIYSLSIMKSFMEQNGLKNGLLFTSDPYSEIVDENDKNTSLIFGDGATVTLLSLNGTYSIGKSNFYTDGSLNDTLIHRNNEYLYMNGRMIFNFVMENAPKVIDKCLQLNKCNYNDIDVFILHQASKYIVDNLTRRMKLDKNKVPFEIKQYGNTVSSSIPIILEQYINNNADKILLCGFGVGLSIASTMLHKN